MPTEVGAPLVTPRLRYTHPVGDAPASRYDLSDAAPDYAFRLLDILEDLATDLERDVSCTEGLVVWLGTGIGLVLLWMAGGFAGGLAWAAVLIGYDAVVRHLARRAEFAIRDGLDRSGVTDRVLLGPAYLVDIFREVPWYFRAAFFNRPPETVRGWLTLAANNLDWYVRPPRIRVRPEWVMWLAVPAGLLAQSVMPLQSLSWVYRPSQYQLVNPFAAISIVYGLLTLFSVWVVASAAKQRRLVCVRALQADLQYHFILHRE